MVHYHDDEIEDTRPDNYDDENVVQRAISDTQNEPSIWWIDFLEQDFDGKDSVKLEQQLADSMRLVKEYRNWESLRAWRYVFSNDKVPKDSSAMSTAQRTSLFAETSVTDAKFDSWYMLPQSKRVSETYLIPYLGWLCAMNTLGPRRFPAKQRISILSSSKLHLKDFSTSMST